MASSTMNMNDRPGHRSQYSDRIGHPGHEPRQDVVRAAALLSSQNVDKNIAHSSMSLRDPRGANTLAISHAPGIPRVPPKSPTQPRDVATPAVELPTQTSGTTSDPRRQLAMQRNRTSSVFAVSHAQDDLIAWIKQLVRVAALERESDELRSSAVTWRENEDTYKRKFPESAPINESCSSIRRKVEAREAKHTKAHKEAVDKELTMPGRSILLGRLTEQQADQKTDLTTVMARLNETEGRLQALADKHRDLQREHNESLIQLRKLQSQQDEDRREASNARDNEQQLTKKYIQKEISELESGFRSENNTLDARLRSLEEGVELMKTDVPLRSAFVSLEEGLGDEIRTIKQDYVLLEAHNGAMDELSRLHRDVQRLESRELNPSPNNSPAVVTVSDLETLKQDMVEGFRSSTAKHVAQTELNSKLTSELTAVSERASTNTSQLQAMQVRFEAVAKAIETARLLSNEDVNSMSNRLEIAEQSTSAIQEEANRRLAHLEEMSNGQATSITQVRQQLLATDHSIQSLSVQYNAITTTTLYKRIVSLCAPVVTEIEDSQKKIKELTSSVDEYKPVQSELKERMASVETSLNSLTQRDSVLSLIQDRVAQLEEIVPELRTLTESIARLRDSEATSRELVSEHRALTESRTLQVNDLARDLNGLETRVTELVKSSAKEDVAPRVDATMISTIENIGHQYNTLAENFEDSRIALVADVERLKLIVEGSCHVQISNLPSKIDTAEDLSSLLHKKLPEFRGKIQAVVIFGTQLPHAAAPSKKANPSARLTLANAYDAAEFVQAVCGRTIRGRCWSAKLVASASAHESAPETASESRLDSDPASIEPVLDLAEWQLRQSDESPSQASMTVAASRRRKAIDELEHLGRRTKRKRSQS